MNGELGDGSFLFRLIPTLTLLKSNVIDISSGYSHSIVTIKTDKKCFNKNETDINVN